MSCPLRGRSELRWSIRWGRKMNVTLPLPQCNVILVRSLAFCCKARGGMLEMSVSSYLLSLPEEIILKVLGDCDHHAILACKRVSCVYVHLYFSEMPGVRLADGCTMPSPDLLVYAIRLNLQPMA